MGSGEWFGWLISGPGRRNFGRLGTKGQRQVGGYMEVCMNAVQGSLYCISTSTSKRPHRRVSKQTSGQNDPPADTSQLLSTATLALAHWAHEGSSHGGRDGGYV